MKIIAIMSAAGMLYLQAVRNKTPAKVLTQILIEMGISKYYVFEEKILGHTKGETYAEVNDGNRSVQVVLSCKRLHLVIKSPNINEYRKKIISILESS